MLEKNQRTKSMLSGLLDVVLLRPVPRLKLPGLLGSYKKGEHLSGNDTVTEKFAPYMTFFRTGSIDIEVLGIQRDSLTLPEYKAAM